MSDNELRVKAHTPSAEEAPQLTSEILLAAVPGLTEAQKKGFITYYNRLIERNSRVNLTRITEPADVAYKHFADSLLGAELDTAPSSFPRINLNTRESLTAI